MTGGGNDYAACELSHLLSEMDGRKPSATGASVSHLVWFISPGEPVIRGARLSLHQP